MRLANDGLVLKIFTYLITQFEYMAKNAYLRIREINNKL